MAQNKPGGRRRSPQAASSYGFTTLTYGRRLLLTACFFCLMMVLAGFSTQIAANFFASGTRNFYIATSVLQNLIGFCGGAAVTALFLSTKPLALLGLDRVGSSHALLGIVLVMALGLPLLNQVTYWNEHFHLPPALASLQDTFRSWEDTAQAATRVMLDTRSFGGLVVGILVIGIFTGFSEELLFRGTFQRVLASGGMNSHVAVWTAAAVFSLLHFQFFGFLPRLLLGAFFGYLLLWTGSIYISAAAHALNNSVYVLLHWLTLRGDTSIHADYLGVTTSGFPAIATVSLVMTLIVLIGMRRYLFSTHKV